MLYRCEGCGFWLSGEYGCRPVCHAMGNCPIVRDTAEKETADKVRRKFIADAQLDQCEFQELANLRAAGWRESCPSENAWHFAHPDFPGVSVTWRHDGAIWVAS